MKTEVMAVFLIMTPILCLAQTTDIRNSYGDLVGTRRYDRSTGDMEFRDQYGDLKYTGKRNDNGYEIRDSYGDLKWTEQSED
ncbi:MAG: hypothetical protein M1511_15150 [Deltaproteobacteria bacterium]|nr:hypothetical protein [Deltaproteobacteria bacterium]